MVLKVAVVDHEDVDDNDENIENDDGDSDILNDHIYNRFDGFSTLGLRCVAIDIVTYLLKSCKTDHP